MVLRKISVTAEMVIHIASAMTYLETKNFIHRDLVSILCIKLFLCVCFYVCFYSTCSLMQWVLNTKISPVSSLWISVKILHPARISCNFSCTLLWVCRRPEIVWLAITMWSKFVILVSQGTSLILFQVQE